MALPSEVNSLDSVSEQYRDQYVADGDLFVLDVETINGRELANTVNLKSALQNERTSVTKLNGQLKAFEGVDVEAARAAIEKVKTMDDWTPTEKVQKQIQSAKDQMLAAHKSEIKLKDDEIDSVTGQLQNLLIVQEATKEIIKQGGDVEVLLPHTTANATMEKVGNTRVLVINDGTGNVKVNGDGQNYSFSDVVADLKKHKSFTPNFRPIKAGGGGTDPSSQNKPSNNSTEVVITEEQARDTTFYRAQRAIADEKKIPFVIRG